VEIYLAVSSIQAINSRYKMVINNFTSRLGNNVSTVASLLSGDFSSSLSKTGSISRSKSSLLSMESKGPSRQTSDVSIRSEHSQSHSTSHSHRPVIKQPLHPQSKSSPLSFGTYHLFQGNSQGTPLMPAHQNGSPSGGVTGQSQ